MAQIVGFLFEYCSPIGKRSVAVGGIELRELQRETAEVLHVATMSAGRVLFEVEHLVKRDRVEVDADHLEVEVDHLPTGGHRVQIEEPVEARAYSMSIAHRMKIESVA